MDAETLKYVEEIGVNLDSLTGKSISSGQVLDLEEHVSFLLQLVQKQESRLAKYELVEKWSRETVASWVNGDNDIIRIGCLSQLEDVLNELEADT